MDKHKHNWHYLMLFRIARELEPNPKGVLHSKTCRDCGKEFIYKAGKVWSEEQIKLYFTSKSL